MQNALIIGGVALIAIVGIIFLTGSDETTPTEDAVVTQDTTTQDPAMNSNSMDSMDSMDSEAGVMVGGAAMLPSRTIVENAVNASNVTTLVAAVTAADLVDTLQGPGPFTVFAPTNDAFAALPAGTVDTLLEPENIADLQSILTYHVVAGTYTAADLSDGMTLTTVNGAELEVTVEGGMVMINGAATVETADVISSNGVTHVIDSVLLPPTE